MFFPPASQKTPISPFCWHFIKKYQFTHQFTQQAAVQVPATFPTKFHHGLRCQTHRLLDPSDVECSRCREWKEIWAVQYLGVSYWAQIPIPRPKKVPIDAPANAHCLPPECYFSWNIEVFCIWYSHHLEEISNYCLSFSSLTCFRSLMVISTGTNFPSWQGHGSCGYQGSMWWSMIIWDAHQHAIVKSEG